MKTLELAGTAYRKEKDLWERDCQPIDDLQVQVMLDLEWQRREDERK